MILNTIAEDLWHLLELMLADYNKEKYVKYDDGFGEEEYTVLRTYKKSSDRIELTLVRGVNNASS